MTCYPSSDVGHKYIIVVIDYFTKWVESMPTFSSNCKTATLFMFDHIIARFGVPKKIVMDHGSHFQNTMMMELSTTLGFKQENLCPYYPQENEQVEAVNNSLKFMLLWIVDKNRSNWNIMLFSTLQAYISSFNTTTRFTPFELVYGIEFILPIECEIPSLKLVIELLPDTTKLKKQLSTLTN